MADRDGYVLHLPGPLGTLRSVVVFCVMLGFGLSLPFGQPSVTMVLGALSVAIIRARTKLLFRAQALERRWLLQSDVTPYAEIAGFDLLEDRLRLRLRGGGVRDVLVRMHVTAARRTMLELAAYVLTQASGIVPDSGEITTVGEQTVPKLANVGDAPSLTETMRRASEMARARGASAIDASDLALAMLAGPDRALIAACGVDLALVPRVPEGAPYRGEEVLAASPSLRQLLHAARVSERQRGGTELGARAVLLEIVRAGDDASAPLLSAGFVPIRYLDYLAHELSPEASDARARGEVEFDVDATHVQLVLVNDGYTPYVVVSDLVQDHLDLHGDEADLLARRVHTEGRVAFGHYHRAAGAELANALMKDARRRGSPLLVELKPAEADER